MPELPEVETIARQLRPLLISSRLRSIEILDPKLAFDCAEELTGLRIRDVYRAGKEIVIELARPGDKKYRRWLCIHLRMTGRLIWQAAGSLIEKKHLRALIMLDKGILLFYDQRRFGVFRVCRMKEELTPAGQEPLHPDFTAEIFTGLLKGSRQEIKPWLLRQDRLVGLGNIYASEILFDSRISPTRAAGSLGKDEIKRLHAATRRVLNKAVRHCGTTFSDYRDTKGRSGSFQNCLKVYGREGERCPRCRKLIERINQQGRSTFYCPGCQL